MQKSLQAFIIFLFTTTLLSAQSTKEQPIPSSTTPPTPDQLNLRPEAINGRVPSEGNFGVSDPNYKPAGPLVRKPARVRIERDTNGAPIAYYGTTAATQDSTFASPAEAALAHWVSLMPEDILNPAEEFKVTEVHTDEQANHHVRLAQYHHNLPVYGSEITVHSQNGQFVRANGRFYSTPTLAESSSQLDANAAILAMQTDFGLDKVKTEWTAQELLIIGKEQPYEATLVVYPAKQATTYAWHILAHPNLMRRVHYFVDAQTGAILHKYE